MNSLISGVMNFEFSEVGRKLTTQSGILELMVDLGRAMTDRPDMLMLGGGNPAAVPAMQELWRSRMRDLLEDENWFDRMLGNYDPPRGNPVFIQALADLLKKTFGWEIHFQNIAVTNGGQSAFFFLFNLLAGRFENGRTRKILLPLTPEYIGYADQGIDESMFVACRPEITWPSGPESRIFKYQIDFNAVETAFRDHDIAAIAVSRPTNPTGNVLTDAEMQRLAELAADHGIPLIIDNAYGAPFPGVIFTDAKPYWAPHVIMTLSLSKLGLPGTRTAVVIGPEQITSAVSAMTAICGLANGNVGQQLVLPLVESGEILELGPRHLVPFYEKKSHLAQEWIREFFSETKVDWALHASEGAFFHWIWLRGLKIPTRELYTRLKERNVLVVPGEYFFFGLDQDWSHRHECLRLNFSQPAHVVREGLRIIADEANRATIS